MRLVSSRPVRLALIAMTLSALSGCSWVGGWFGSGAKEAPAASCPTAAILRPLSQTAVFAPGAQRQPIGVAFYGVLSEVNAKCDRSGDALRIALDVLVFGERGPAAGGGPGVDLQYFMAVTGPGQTVLSKRSFPVHIDIPANAKRAGLTDHIEETIALGGRPAGDLNVVLGFQQTPEAVEFYKHFRGR